MKKKLALLGLHIEVFVAPKRSASYDIDIATSSLFPTFVSLLKNTKSKQKKPYAIKFQICMQAFLEQFSIKNNKQINIDVWFPSNTYSILELSGAHKKIKTALCDIFLFFNIMTVLSKGAQVGY